MSKVMRNRPKVTNVGADAVNIPLSSRGMQEHRGIAVDTFELKAIRESRRMGPQYPEPEVEETVIQLPMVSVRPLPKSFSKPLPVIRLKREPKPIEPVLTNEQRAERRLEKRQIALALYKQQRGK